QNCALERLHPVVESAEHVPISAVLAPIAQTADDIGVPIVVRHDDSALTVGAEILRGIEAEAGEVSEAPRAASVIAVAMRLSRVLDHDGARVARDLEDRIHITGLAVQMYRHDGLRARRDRCLESARIERQ